MSSIRINRGGAAAGASAGLTIGGEAGMVAYNKGHARVLSLIATNGIDVVNGDGLLGKPEFRASIQNRIAWKTAIPCHVTTPTVIDVQMPGIRSFRIREVLFNNPTVAPDAAFRAAIYTHRNRQGTLLFPSTEPLTGLTNDLTSLFEWPVSALIRRKKRSHPMFHFYAEAPNSAEMYMDVYIIGDVLEWETEIKRWQASDT